VKYVDGGYESSTQASWPVKCFAGRSDNEQSLITKMELRSLPDPLPIKMLELTPIRITCVIPSSFRHLVDTGTHVDQC
jgi:hypothetical protein